MSFFLPVKMKVKVKKLKPSDVPKMATPKMEDYRVGELNENVSLPINYEIEGTCDDIPKVGFSFSVLRTKRNGVESFGFFFTSPVKNLIQTGDTFFFETENSIYQFEILSQ